MCLVNGEIFLVCKSCKFVHKKSTVFLTQWWLEFETNHPNKWKIYVVSSATIVHHCLMIPHITKETSFLDI